ncbi:MAG TPA: DUF3037 domain-containing protein [Bryobacteraceae bacterium]|nr:DUF3037 domain-containing protein [Bryobacteraceae bacterium]
MIPYSFCALRYVHDAVTSEFINVGIAMFSTEVPFFRARCTIQYGRITRMFDRIDGERFKQTVRFIEEEINLLGDKLWQRSFPFSDFEPTIEAMLKRVLTPDDSAIQFSAPAYGVSLDLEATLSQLYERYVERYAGQADIPSRSDDEVWRVFREPLERRRLLSHLQPKKIVAPDFEYEFRAGWKNELWHVYEPVSFDLIEPASLLDKANRWLGRSANLTEGSERFQLHLLVGAPQNPRLEEAFRRSRNILGKMSGNPEIVMESDAERFAADLEHEIRIHQDGERSLFRKR